MLYLRAPSLAKQLELSSPLLKPARGLSRCLVRPLSTRASHTVPSHSQTQLRSPSPVSLQWDSRIWPGLSGTRYGATKACRIQRTPPPPSPSASAILGSRHLSTTRALDRDDRKMSEKVTAATTKLLTTLTSQHENIYTIPNILTFSRLAMAPVIGWAILSSHATLALSLFGYAAVTDLVDGFVARRFKQESVVGTIIDPMADKVLMTVGVVCLSLQSAIPLWLATIIIGRDVALSISAIYFRWISLPPPKTMARYWDFSLPSAEVKPTLISKVNTALQLGLVWSAMTIPVVSGEVLEAWHVGEGMLGLQYLVAATTVGSGLSYIFSKNAVKILSEGDIRERIARQRGEKGRG